MYKDNIGFKTKQAKKTRNNEELVSQRPGDECRLNKRLMYVQVRSYASQEVLSNFYVCVNIFLERALKQSKQGLMKQFQQISFMHVYIKFDLSYFFRHYG